MPKKIAHHQKIQIVGVLMIVLAILTALNFYSFKDTESVPKSIEEPSPLGSSKPTVENIGFPERIKIPSIELEASIEKVALTNEGLMDVPSHPLDTGWYELGVRPGEIGSAVIDGHVDGPQGEEAVFTDLNKVKPGDLITVGDDAGKIISFVVREIRIFEAKADATDVFISTDGKAHLNLITCEGVWNETSKTYSKRLVVFADRE